MGGLGGVHVATITVDCEDPHRLGGFWSALLGIAVAGSRALKRRTRIRAIERDLEGSR